MTINANSEINASLARRCQQCFIDRLILDKLEANEWRLEIARGTDAA